MNLRSRSSAFLRRVLPVFVLVFPACGDNPVKTEIISIQEAPQWRVFSQSHTLGAVTTFADGGGVAVAGDGFTLMRSGGQWGPVEPMVGDGVVILDLWGPASNDVFAVGTAGSILHNDGSAWTEMTSGVSVDLHGVWGTASDDVFAVGDGGTILHYDGAAWSAMTSNTQSALYGVHGTGPTQVFAVGDGGAFAEYDGTSWSAHNQGTKDFRSVYAPDPTEVLVVGPSGRAVQRKDGAWAPFNPGVSGTWTSISGTSVDDVYICDAFSIVVHYDGSAWSTLYSHPNGTETFRDLDPTEDGGMIVVGNFTRVFEYSENQWHTEFESPIPSVGLSGVWYAGDSDAFLCGGGTMWRVTGGEVERYDMGSRVTAVWGTGPTDVFAVGDIGDIAHFDGSAWETQVHGSVQSSLRLKAVFGTAPDDVLAAGDDVAHYDGAAWTPLTAPDGVRFNGVWASGYQRYLLVGRDGAAWSYTGVQWLEFDSGTSEHLNGVWGSSWDDVFAVGDGGTIIHYDGSVWTPMESGTTEDLRAIWGRSADDVYVAGGHQGIADTPIEPFGVALHYNGDAWETIGSGPDRLFFHVAGDANETTWVSGSRVVKFSP